MKLLANTNTKSLFCLLPQPTHTFIVYETDHIWKASFGAKLKVDLSGAPALTCFLFFSLSWRGSGFWARTFMIGAGEGWCWHSVGGMVDSCLGMCSQGYPSPPPPFSPSCRSPFLHILPAFLSSVSSSFSLASLLVFQMHNAWHALTTQWML